MKQFLKSLQQNIVRAVILFVFFLGIGISKSREAKQKQPERIKPAVEETSRSARLFSSPSETRTLEE